MTSRLLSWRSLVGFLAIALLLTGAWWLPSWGALRQRAVVEAAHTFGLASVASGTYEWSLHDGRPARGQGLVRTRILQFERNDLVEMSLESGLSTGDRVTAGQLLGRIHSPRSSSELAEVRAQRDTLVAERALLGAGGKPSEVTEARKRLELAEVARQGQARELARVRELLDQGATSPAEYELAELEDKLRAVEVELARAGLEVTRAPARPEALSALDAEIAGVDVRISELERLGAEDELRTPISGILELGGSNVVLRVYDLDTVYLRIPIPEADRGRVEVDQRVRLRTPSWPSEVFEGRIVDVGQDASGLNGLQVFWLSAEVPNPEHKLRSGMTGVVDLSLSGKNRGFFSTILQTLMQ